MGKLLYSFVNNFGFNDINIEYEDNDLNAFFVEDEFHEVTVAEEDPTPDDEIICNNARSNDVYDNLYSNMINRSYVQLSNIFGEKINFAEVAGMALEVQEMIKDRSNIRMRETNRDCYLTLLSVSTIKIIFNEYN